MVSMYIWTNMCADTCTKHSTILWIINQQDLTFYCITSPLQKYQKCYYYLNASTISNQQNEIFRAIDKNLDVWKR